MQDVYVNKRMKQVSTVWNKSVYSSATYGVSVQHGKSKLPCFLQ